MKSVALLLVLLEVTNREVGSPQNGGAANDLHVNLTESYGIGVSKTILVLELSKQVQRLVMVDFPRALPTQTLTWP